MSSSLDSKCQRCGSQYHGQICPFCTITGLDVHALLAAEGLTMPQSGSNSSMPDSEAEATAAASQVTLVDVVSNRTFPVTTPICRFGRDISNDIVLTGDKSLSRFHFQITLLNGDYFVEDSGSRNGSFLNGSPVTAPRKVLSGDIISAGMTRYRFVLGDDLGPFNDLEDASADMALTPDAAFGENGAPLPPPLPSDAAGADPLARIFQEGQALLGGDNSKETDEVNLDSFFDKASGDDASDSGFMKLAPISETPVDELFQDQIRAVTAGSEHKDSSETKHSGNGFNDSSVEAELDRALDSLLSDAKAEKISATVETGSFEPFEPSMEPAYVEPPMSAVDDIFSTFEVCEKAETNGSADLSLPSEPLAFQEFAPPPELQTELPQEEFTPAQLPQEEFTPPAPAHPTAPEASTPVVVEQPDAQPDAQPAVVELPAAQPDAQPAAQTEEEPAWPVWSTSFQVPELADATGRITALQAEIDERLAEIAEREAEMAKLHDSVCATERVKNRLLAARDQQLRDAIASVFTDLGWETAPYSDSNDLVVLAEGRAAAILRIVCTDSQPKPNDLAGLVSNLSTYWSEHGIEPKGILLVSFQTDGHPSDRPSVSADYAGYASKKNVCVMSTTQLLAIYRDVVFHRADVESIKTAILDTSGQLPGYDNATTPTKGKKR